MAAEPRETPQRTGYLDALLLLFANLPTDLGYTADTGRWSRAVMWLRDRHDAEYPQLFDDLSFSAQSGRDPYSRQVGELLTLVQFGDLVEVRNPGYSFLHIKDEAQKRVREQIEQQVPREVREIAKQMAAELIEQQRDTVVVSG